MIRNRIEPGQKLAVDNEDYNEISCMCGDTVEELMWGLKIQMPYLVLAEKSKLNEEDRFPMSKGMKQLLNRHGFIFEPDLMVTRHIINLAGVVRECDRFVNKHDYSLRSATEHLKRISGIDTREWDLMKLSTALKMICYPEEKIAAAPLLFSKRVLVKLRKDAPKYEGKILKEPLLIIYNEMYCARRGRSNALRKLSHLLEQRKRIQEVIVQLTECNENLGAECNKRQNPPTLAPDALGRYTFISSHQLHRMNEPGILSMHIHPSKVWEASEQDGYTSASFHPHGLLLGTGMTTVVKIWDMKTHSHVANLKGHVGPVTAMSFSENGYLLVTAGRDGRLWDVRKLTNLRTISPYDSGTPTNAVEFDSSGSYLGIGGSDARVYQADKAEWNIIRTLPDLSGTGKVTSLKFGADAKYIAVGSMDCNLRIFGLPGDEQMGV